MNEEKKMNILSKWKKKKGSSQPREQTRSPTLQVDSLLSEPRGKPKNTGVGSPSLLQQVFQTLELKRGLLHCRWIFFTSWVTVRAHWLSRVWLLGPHGLWPTRLLCPWDFPGKNTRVGCHSLLQGIFLTQGSNPHRRCLHWQASSSALSHLGSPAKLPGKTKYGIAIPRTVGSRCYFLLLIFYRWGNREIKGPEICPNPYISMR